MQGAWVISLVRELRSHMPHSIARKKKKEYWGWYGRKKRKRRMLRGFGWKTLDTHLSVVCIENCFQIPRPL